MNRILISLNILFLKQLSTIAVLFKQDQRALDYWRRIHLLAPQNAFNMATLSHFEANHGDKLRAKALMLQSLALKPQQSGVWFNLGYLQQESEDHLAAIQSFDKAVDINPKQDRALYGKAISLIKLGKLDEAIICLKQNTKLQPLSPFAWYQLAHIYAKRNDHDRVAKTIRKIASFEPKVAMQLERETGVKVGIVLPFQ